jgi:hypothetical protein
MRRAAASSQQRNLQQPAETRTIRVRLLRQCLMVSVVLILVLLVLFTKGVLQLPY